MNMNENRALWAEFAQQQKLSTQQLEQFQVFYTMLVEANELFNLTTITELKPALADHFEDSLVLGAAFDVTQITFCADVGTGGGFPGIPLKIKYPHLKMVLIEVTYKKVLFLREVIERLGLADIEVCEIDWRTFLRQTEYPIELFCARASLRPDELIRMFQPSSFYKHAQLVYWASEYWLPDNKEQLLLKQEFQYSIKHKQRRLYFFGI